LAAKAFGPGEKLSRSVEVFVKLYADGRREVGPFKMSLGEMQHFVGGYLESVPTHYSEKILIIAEEGIRLELPVNLRATAFVKSGTGMLGGVIRGNALLCNLGPDEDFEE
jgi:hypothetical protein